MHVLFVEPAFPRSQRQHVRALKEIGARVTGIGESPQDALDPELRSWLDDYEQVRSVTHEPSLEQAVRNAQGRGWVDRLEATIEAHVLPVARVRERCEIPGTSERTAFLCRDKAAMKHVLREAGIPTAASTGASTVEGMREFAEREGYPLVVKPLDAAGASGTYRVEDDKQLEDVAKTCGVPQGRAVAIEEWIEGHEGFYDTVCADGRIVHDFACHYFPNVLEAMRTRWISPQIVSTNRIDLPDYDEVRKLGQQVVEILGIETSATHMEWFFGPKGLKFSEIGCRPPGVGTWNLYSAGNDFDIFVEWAKLVCTGKTDSRPSRRYATGLVAIRPERDGRIHSVEGLESIRRQFGPHILQEQMPRAGTPTQDVENGYHANGWLTMRHEDYDELRRMLDLVGETVSLRAH